LAYFDVQFHFGLSGPSNPALHSSTRMLVG